MMVLEDLRNKAKAEHLKTVTMRRYQMLIKYGKKPYVTCTMKTAFDKNVKNAPYNLQKTCFHSKNTDIVIVYYQWGTVIAERKDKKIIQ